MKEFLNNTFGVEVEMYRISRPVAAQVVCDTLNRLQPLPGGKKWVVEGPSYHLDCRHITYPGCPALDRWAVESDSSIRDSREQRGTAELVSPVMRWEQMGLLQEVVRELRKAGARSDAAHACGVHVHVGGDGHTAQSLRNLANLMASHEQLLIGALTLDLDRTSTWCRPVHLGFLRDVNAAKPTDLRELRKIWYTSQGDVYMTHYNDTRYHMLNLHSFFEGKGVEFRLFQFDNWDASKPAGQRGGIHAGQLKAYVQLCLAMDAYARKARNCKPTALVSDNQKYTMRCWLLRLGFIGDEFATARDVLTRRLPGDTAWRYGRPTNGVA